MDIEVNDSFLTHKQNQKKYFWFEAINNILASLLDHLVLELTEFSMCSCLLCSYWIWIESMVHDFIGNYHLSIINVIIVHVQYFAESLQSVISVSLLQSP